MPSPRISACMPFGLSRAYWSLLTLRTSSRFFQQLFQIKRHQPQLAHVAIVPRLADDADDERAVRVHGRFRKPIRHAPHRFALIGVFSDQSIAVSAHEDQSEAIHPAAASYLQAPHHVTWLGFERRHPIRRALRPAPFLPPLGKKYRPQVPDAIVRDKLRKPHFEANEQRPIWRDVFKILPDKSTANKLGFSDPAIANAGFERGKEALAFRLGRRRRA